MRFLAFVLLPAVVLLVSRPVVSSMTPRQQIAYLERIRYIEPNERKDLLCTGLALHLLEAKWEAETEWECFDTTCKKTSNYCDLDQHAEAVFNRIKYGCGEQRPSCQVPAEVDYVREKCGDKPHPPLIRMKAVYVCFLRGWTFNEHTGYRTGTEEPESQKSMASRCISRFSSLLRYVIHA